MKVDKEENIYYLRNFFEKYHHKKFQVINQN